MKLLKMANPIAVTESAFGLAGSTVGLVQGLVGHTAHALWSGLHRLTEPTTAAPDHFSGTDVEDAPGGPTIVPVEPHAPEEPPVDVVGEALAAEAALGDRESPDGAGFAHEPRGASRDEEHGDVPLQRAEADGIAEEVAAALEGDVEPEEHLTGPLLDPAEAKALAAEMQTLTRAADPDKG